MDIQIILKTGSSVTMDKSVEVIYINKHMPYIKKVPSIQEEEDLGLLHLLYVVLETNMKVTLHRAVNTTNGVGLCFEFALKHPKNRKSGIKGRVEALNYVGVQTIIPID